MSITKRGRTSRAASASVTAARTMLDASSAAVTPRSPRSSETVAQAPAAYASSPRSDAATRRSFRTVARKTRPSVSSGGNRSEPA